MINADFHMARLISGYLSDSITPEERTCLDEWRKESEEHELLFQRICDEEYRERHEARKQNYDLQTGWKEVERRIKRMNFRKRCLVMLRCAAIFAVPVLIAILTYRNVIEVPSAKDSHLAIAALPIMPGEAKAILTLDNGEILFLDKNAGEQQARLVGEQVQVDSTTLSYRASRQKMEQAMPIYNKVEIPQGGEYTLVLNDGTKVHLNSVSSLRFPVMFGTGKREVELTGEAYFEVSQSEQPFVVHTQGMQIEVLGTVFNVSAYPGEEYQTTLVSGSVKVNAEGGRSLVLKPSQQARWRPGDEEMQVCTVETAFYTSWVKGKINFKDQRLEEIMKILARWYNIEVNYTNETLKNKRFGCYVNRYEEINPFLELLEATGNVHVEINGKTITFYTNH
ncbi:FecR family protein [uncultured Bacteroides sp.]|uniref:FecR family protein n=1 Tax=uncultured Bacteroides sp. TaxID=162156 RepID=UPI00345BB249